MPCPAWLFWSGVSVPGFWSVPGLGAVPWSGVVTPALLSVPGLVWFSLPAWFWLGEGVTVVPVPFSPVWVSWPGVPVWGVSWPCWSVPGALGFSWPFGVVWPGVPVAPLLVSGAGVPAVPAVPCPAWLLFSGAVVPGVPVAPLLVSGAGVPAVPAVPCPAWLSLSAGGVTVVPAFWLPASGLACVSVVPVFWAVPVSVVPGLDWVPWVSCPVVPGCGVVAASLLVLPGWVSWLFGAGVAWLGLVSPGVPAAFWALPAEVPVCSPWSSVLGFSWSVVLVLGLAEPVVSVLGCVSGWDGVGVPAPTVPAWAPWPVLLFSVVPGLDVASWPVVASGFVEAAGEVASFWGLGVTVAPLPWSAVSAWGLAWVSPVAVVGAVWPVPAVWVPCGVLVAWLSCPVVFGLGFVCVASAWLVWVPVASAVPWPWWSAVFVLAPSWPVCVAAGVPVPAWLFWSWLVVLGWPAVLTVPTASLCQVLPSVPSSACACPKKRNEPTIIEAVPTVNFLIE